MKNNLYKEDAAGMVAINMGEVLASYAMELRLTDCKSTFKFLCSFICPYNDFLLNMLGKRIAILSGV